MGFNFRKSIKLGPARINLSKSGVGYSIGAGGLRYTKRAGGKKKKSAKSSGAFWGWCIAIFLIIGVAQAYPVAAFTVLALAVVAAVIFAAVAISKIVSRRRADHALDEGTTDSKQVVKPTEE